MRKKQRKLTIKEQKVAADILTSYIIAHSDNGFNHEFFDETMKQYELLKDPFTKLPCTPNEYAENSIEYDR